MKRMLFAFLFVFLLSANISFAADSIDGLTADEWSSRGELYVINGDFNNGARAFSNTITIRPNDDYAFFMRGLCFAKLELHHQAIIEFSSAIDLNSKNDKYYVWRAVSLMKRSLYSEALSDFNKALVLLPDNEYALVKRGDCHRFLEHYDEALADYDAVLAKNPISEYSYFGKARIYDSKGNVLLAIENYQQFLKNTNNKNNNFVIEAKMRLEALQDK